MIRPAAEQAHILAPATFQVMRRTIATKQQRHGSVAAPSILFGLYFPR